MGRHDLMFRLALVVLLVSVPGCTELGECDTQAALELVYDQNGVPAFAGQALVVEGCGGGRFCHSPDIELSNRYGAPTGLDFDLSVASTAGELGLTASERLRVAQRSVLDHRHVIWEQVWWGAMPPGALGGSVAGLSEVRHDRIAEDGHTFSPLPGLDTSEGREVLRNWLSCRAPVVERVRPRIDGEVNDTGFTAALCERGCVDVTWPSIYRGVVEPRCATVSCHGVTEAEAELDLLARDASDPVALAEVLDRMIGQTSRGEDCVAEAVPLLTAGDTFASLFYRKLTDEPACGARMPLAGAPIADQQICAIEQWIRCGACADPSDTSCNPDIEACLRSARLRCEVLLDGSGSPALDAEGEVQCAIAERCAPRGVL